MHTCIHTCIYTVYIYICVIYRLVSSYLSISLLCFLVSYLSVQTVADICSCQIYRPPLSAVPLVTSIGGVVAAGLACGFWKGGLGEVQKLLKLKSLNDECFVAKIDNKERENKLFYWNEAVKRSLGWLRTDVDRTDCNESRETETLLKND